LTALQTFGRLDVLVNNAAMRNVRTWHRMSERQKKISPSHDDNDLTTRTKTENGKQRSIPDAEEDEGR
jgi:hypothetical protein